jgi:AraC-like DNA-binding protein
LHHLTRWRIQLAATLLRGSALRTHEIATRVGYATEAAFSRTFKRLTGEAPRDFRRRAVVRGAEGMPPAAELRPRAPAPRRDERRPALLHS